VALLARRIYGRHILRLQESFYQKIRDIDRDLYNLVLERSIQMSTEKVMKIYALREQEPQESQGWVPKVPGFPEDLIGKEEPVYRKDGKRWERIS
jgi:hypothetical protein